MYAEIQRVLMLPTSCMHYKLPLWPFILRFLSYGLMGFPGSSAGKESACNSRDPGLIPGLGRSPGEGIGYPLQYSVACLITHLIKNLPAMWETWVRSLGSVDPLEKGRLPTPIFWPGELHGLYGVTESQKQLSLSLTVLSSMDDLGQDPLIHEDIAKQWFLFSTSPEFNSWNPSMNKNILSNLYSYMKYASHKQR